MKLILTVEKKSLQREKRVSDEGLVCDKEISLPSLNCTRNDTALQFNRNVHYIPLCPQLQKSYFVELCKTAAVSIGDTTFKLGQFASFPELLTWLFRLEIQCWDNC